MDSSVPISRSLRDRTLPFVATFQEDLRQTLRHWAFAAWAVFTLATGMRFTDFRELTGHIQRLIFLCQIQ